MTLTFIDMIPPTLLYAETHYSFRGIYSRLKKSEPEVIADVPHRLDPQQFLPVLLLVKDADTYPIRLGRIEVTIHTPTGLQQSAHFNLEDTVVNTHWWFKIIEVPLQKEIKGLCNVRVYFEISINKRIHKYLNDNYRISSQTPFFTYISEQPLPHFNNWHFGDLHYHSSFTEDQVEFGAPVEATVGMARAMGLTFFAVTDHSYDLDDSISNSLKNDPKLPKWLLLKEKINTLNNSMDKFVVLLGEELSCGNSNGRNVHLLLFDEPQFFHGSGDSAEKWLRTKPELMVENVLPRLSPDSLAYAAHPEIPTPILQWFLIRRGRWQKADYELSRLAGLQILNGIKDKGFQAARKRWIQLLLSGYQKFIIAGNDGHGNFNRFRQIGFPFLTMREHRNQIFGGARTAVKIDGTFDVNSIKNALRSGHNIVTTGPMLDIRGILENGDLIEIGSISRNEFSFLIIRAISTTEFGKFNKLTVYLGRIGRKKEDTLLEVTTFPNPYNIEQRFPLPNLPERLYIRAECTSKTAKQNYIALTNPIWIEKVTD